MPTPIYRGWENFEKLDFGPIKSKKSHKGEDKWPAITWVEDN
jgi:hypothetical protein